MKFEISRTSQMSFTKEPPCKGCTKEYTVVRLNHSFGYNYYTKEINSLDELLNFIKNEADNKVVIEWNEWSNMYEIEIYDDWRE